jgi:hypothetical protein
MHPHPTTKAPHYYDLASKPDQHIWTRHSNQARRFASEAAARKVMAKVTVAPVHVMRLAREEL